MEEEYQSVDNGTTISDSDAQLKDRCSDHNNQVFAVEVMGQSAELDVLSEVRSSLSGTRAHVILNINLCWTVFPEIFILLRREVVHQQESHVNENGCHCRECQTEPMDVDPAQRGPTRASRTPITPRASEEETHELQPSTVAFLVQVVSKAKAFEHGHLNNRRRISC